MSKIAFCLSGGGAKGDFEVGALTFLLRRKIIPNIVCGTSVGAVNAVAIAEGETGIEKLRKVWRSLHSNDDMYKAEPWLTKVLPLINSGGAGVDLDFVRVAMFTPLFPIIAAKLNDAIEVLKAIIEDYQDGKIQGLYNLEPTRKLLKDSKEGIEPTLIAKSGIALRLATVCLQDGDLYYIDEKGHLFKGRADKVPDKAPVVNLVDATLASSAIPVIFKPIKLGDKSFVDGGIREVVPVKAAQEMGAEKIYAVVASESRLDREFSFSEESKKILKSLGFPDTDPIVRIDGIAKRALGCMLNELTEDDLRLRAKLKDNATLWTIRPTIVPELHDALTINPQLIRLSIDYGYMRAWDVVAIAGGGINPILNLPQNSELRQAYKDNTDEIVTLRAKAIELERTCWKRIGEPGPKSGPGAVRFAYYPDKIDQLRKTKKAIANAITARTKFDMYERDAFPPDKSPDTVLSWVQNWEVSQPETIVHKPPATPFSSMDRVGGGSIAAATPPTININ
ncbi:MAG: patatin-like phospholipase family protein [Blastocatellia bacterium]|nr:patatin-like phospholipase family protein [Blastocatellia bacterium]